MKANQAAAHPSEQALSALVNHESRRDEATWSHVVGCAACEARVRELTAMRDGLRAAGDTFEAPPRNLAQDAIRRLRARGAAVAGVNEFFAIWRSLLRGFNVFFGSGSNAAVQTTAPDPEQEPRDG